MTRPARQRELEERKRLRDHKKQVEDERGWAGQHGQHPGSDEEQKYRPNQGGDTKHLDNSSRETGGESKAAVAAARTHPRTAPNQGERVAHPAAFHLLTSGRDQRGAPALRPWVDIGGSA
jgi:hypothetical protein